MLRINKSIRTKRTKTKRKKVIEVRVHMIMKKKEEKIENKIYEQRKAARDTHTAVYIHANVITHNQSEFELMQQFIYIRRASE